MEQSLPPDLARKRELALAHRDDFIGLTADQASSLAQELGVDLQLVLPGQMMTLDFRPTRVRGRVGEDGRVNETSVG